MQGTPLRTIEQKVHLKQVTKFDMGIFNSKKWDCDQISPFPNNVKIKEHMLKAILIKENIKKTREKKGHSPCNDHQAYHCKDPNNL